jgi:FtsH-binding integral membrane protein
MSYYGAERVQVLAAEAPAEARLEFIRKTYAHLAGAVLGCAGLIALLLRSELGQSLAVRMLDTRYGWLVVLGLFMAVGWVADAWARSSKSVGMQYLGLGLFVVAQAIVFLPLLFVAAFYSHPDVIPTAGVLTAIVFGGLTAIVFLTKKDFSFLRGALMIGGLVALGLIVVSILVGFNLGTLFAAGMVVLMSGYVLYYTSNILHHYPVGSHVAAALALFSAIALLFWYVLRLVMAARR